MDKRVYCDFTNKICYSKKEANQVVAKAKWRHQNSKTIPQRSYYCKHCGWYHLTHFRSLQTCKATLRRYGPKGMREF